MLQALLGVVIDHRRCKLTPSAASEATEENGNAVLANASTAATPSSLPVALPGVTSSSIARPTSAWGWGSMERLHQGVSFSSAGALVVRLDVNRLT
jgi:hypothetical protein